MLLGHKRLTLSKYYRILNIRKNNNLSLYANGVTEVNLIVKTSNNIYKKTLKINCNDSTLTFTNYENIGSFVYTSDDYYIYVYFKPTYADRQIYVYSENDNIIAYFENDNTEYELSDLTDYTEINDYVLINGSSYLPSGITGSYKIKTLPDEVLLFNMTIVVDSDLTASNRTLVQDLNLPNKQFVMLAYTSDGKCIGVQYNNGKILIPSSSGNISAGTYRLNGVII